jgi:hypothetical protein
MKGEKKKTIKGEEWAEEQGLILFRGKVYMPKDTELQKKLSDYIIILPFQGIQADGKPWS